MNSTNTSLPRVSVLVIYNNETPELERTITSVVQQSYPALECLLLYNTLPSEGTEFLKQSLFEDVHILADSQESNSSLLQRGIAQASGEYILMLSSGSVLCTNDAIKQLLNSESQERGIIYGNVMRIFPDGKQDTLALPGEVNVENFGDTKYNVLLAALVRKELLIKYQFSDPAITYIHAWAFIIKAVIIGGESYAHKNVLVAKVAVSRSGTWYKLSNAHLIREERARFVDKFAPFLLTNTLTHAVGPEPEAKEKRQTVSFIDKFIERAIGKSKRVINSKVSTAQYYYKSIRSEVELIQYKKKYHQVCLEIPIIINNKNHLTYLKRLISSLEKRGYKNIHIIDNASTYPPLIEFYNHTKYNVFRLPNNVGFCALWDTYVFDQFKDQYYVYTDSDLEIIEECPDDFMVVMHYLLNRYSLGKIGFSLLADDLPDYYENKNEVQSWEKRFQENVVERLALLADVDTTFALYKPNSFGYAGMLPAFRTRFPYSARHLPWYENTQSLTPEQLYYYKNAKTSSHWSSKIKLE